MYHRFKKDTFIRGIKIAFGSAVAIVIAEVLNLDYAVSAGIITLLTISDTRVDTLRLSLHRIISFAVSIITAFIIVNLNIHDNIKFCLYLLIIVEISFLMKWDASVSTNAVFGTHIFLLDSNLNVHIFLNELGLLIIGILLAVIMNIKMPDMEKEIRKDMLYVESEIKRIFSDIIKRLSKKIELAESKEETVKLINHLELSVKNAIKNRNNTFEEHSEFYINYFIMRKNQSVILLHLIRTFLVIESLPQNMAPVADFLNDMAENFSIKNNVNKRLSMLYILIDDLKKLSLPTDRYEFEMMSSILHILKELEEFMKLKQEFYKHLTPEQTRLYLGMNI